MSEEDNLFSRWSRRKRRVAEEDLAQPPAKVGLDEPVQEEPETPEEEAALLERLNLPSPESLKAGDDFSVFMKAGVPEFLRKRALRVLWRSNPVLANLDGLNDYDDDFRSPELTKKVLATAYKVGRGLLRDDPSPEIMQNNDKDTEVSDEAPIMPAADDQPEERVAEDTVAAEAGEVEAVEPGTDFSFNPKRMRFQT